MIKVKLKQTALLVLTLLATTMATAQTVNMSRYITLTVTQGEQIELNFKAAAAGTGVRVVSGSTNTVVPVDTSWTRDQFYTAGAGTMTVYGDITGFDCSENRAYLTALDVSQNTALIELSCWGNQLTSLNVTQNTALRDLDCKNNRLTSLDVTQNTALEDLDCKNNRLTSLNVTQNTALKGLDCGNNQLTVLYVSQNTALIELDCENNRLTSLNVTQNTALEGLDCGQNRLTSLDVSRNRALTGLLCYKNRLTSLDVSQNRALTGLHCYNNRLTSLDVSQNTALKYLWCHGNQLTSLDVSQNTPLKELDCHGNNFTTQAFDDLMCSLPVRAAGDDARFYPLSNFSDANHTAFMAANSRIAKGKEWKMRYAEYVGVVMGATAGTYVCGGNSGSVNMNKYITLTVQQGQQIRLELMAATATGTGTSVKIKSGSTEAIISVGTWWTGTQSYTAGATTMTIYGDITGLNCSENGAKLTALDVTNNTALTSLWCYGNQLTSLDVSQNRALTSLWCYDNQLPSLNVSHNRALTYLLCDNNRLTALDVSRNTALTRLWCGGNNFTTQAFDDLMCSLPARDIGDYAEFYPLDNASDANHAAFMAANSQIAKDKRWEVSYRNVSGAIPATTGTYVCPNMNRYITLTVRQGEQIQLDLKAAAAGTLVKIVSGSNETAVTVGTSWTGYQNHTAGAGTMTVYGDITGFDCRDNGAKLTSLDVTRNTALTELWCQANQITSLDVTNNRELTRLWCFNNRLTSLNVSQNTALEYLSCRGNQLTSLDVSQNTALKELYCYNNRLTALDVSQNRALIKLNCRGNNFTTQAFNDLMCSLPAHVAGDNARFYPLLNVSDANHATFMAANSQIATDKNWQVRYWAGSEDEIPATNGMYVCGGGSGSVNMSKYITLTVQQGQPILLDLRAVADGTLVKIVSGSIEQTITVGRLWIGSQYYTAGATTMTVYGDITGFDCSYNGAKITSLDVTRNTALKELWCQANQITSLDVGPNTALKSLICHGNNFTTRVFNDLMCSLPARTTADNAKFVPLYNASDANYAAFMAASSQIAKDKNWQVRYGTDGADIPNTNGTYVCSNMNRYITLTVRQGQGIWLSLKAAADGTGVKIVSGSTEEVVAVGTNWTGNESYTAGAGTMTVYGDITGFDCSENGAKLTALDARHNTALTELRCHNNQITSLDIDQNSALKTLRCHGNNFTTQAFNDLMCSLPARTTADGARFYPLYNAYDANYAAFRAANAQIATGKNWQVRYRNVGGDITTNGTYTCPQVNMNRYITLTVRQGEQIQLDLKAAAAGTGVKVVSGSSETVVTVGTSWTGFRNYTAGAGTMTVYGDITGFDCSENEAKLTALDASQNTALEMLLCFGNNFTVQAFNDLMCSLPARATSANARFYPLYSASDAGASAFMAANSQIATGKNWHVRYYDGAEIPATTGTYTCPVIGIAEVASVPLAVYPNPATDILTVETEAIGAAITLTDLTGRTVLTATATETKTTLNVSELSAGTYIVRVGNRVGKVIKK